MTQVAFSAGRLYVAPTGADTAVLQPTEAGELQGIDIDFGAGAHFLADAHGWAVATGRGRRSIRCSAEVARLSADFYAAAIAGRIQTGRARVVRDEPAVVTGGTVTAAQAGCDGNLGVIDAATGAWLVRAAAPGPGQYATDDAGTWTFNAAEEGRAVLVSYQRHDAAGYTLALGDRMGHTPRFSAVLSGEFEGQRIVLELFSCAVFAGAFGSKLGQFVIPGFTFAAMSPPDGIVGRLSLEGQVVVRSDALVFLWHADNSTALLFSSPAALTLSPMTSRNGASITSSPAVYGGAARSAASAYSRWESLNEPGMRVDLTAFTLEAWVYLTTSATRHFPIASRYVYDPVLRRALQVWMEIESGFIQTYVLGLYLPSITAPVGAWFHYAISASAVDDTNALVKVYIDGVLSSSGVLPFTVAQTIDTGWCIGGTDPSTSSNFAECFVDDFRVVYGRAVYSSDFTPSGPFTTEVP